MAGRPGGGRPRGPTPMPVGRNPLAGWVCPHGAPGSGDHGEPETQAKQEWRPRVVKPLIADFPGNREVGFQALFPHF